MARRPTRQLRPRSSRPVSSRPAANEHGRNDVTTAKQNGCSEPGRLAAMMSPASYLASGLMYVGGNLLLWLPAVGDNAAMEVKPPQSDSMAAMSESAPPRRRRWPGIVLAILLWSFVIVLTIATVPSLFRDGGWPAIAACVAWSVGTAAAVMVGVWFAQGRLGKKPMLAAFFLFTCFVVALFAPPVTVAIIYGSEAATAAVYLAFLFGWGTINIFALFASSHLRRQARKVERFLARFKEAPIGNWRGIRYAKQDEEGCQVVFNPDGQGHFRLWDAPDRESAAQPIPFRWQAPGEHRIDVNLVDDQTSKELEFGIAFCGGTSVRMLLSVRGIEPPEQSPYDIGFAEYDQAHWPRWVVFDYLGEPES
jgi:hypothetical protein